MNGEYVSADDLRALQFGSIGSNVQLHRSCVVVNPSRIQIGSNVRIDPFCQLSANGGIVIGDHVHIGTSCLLVGDGEITLQEFSGLSAGCKLFSSSDSYNGDALVGPTIPTQFRHVQAAKITLNQHVIIGAGSTIMPGCEIATGSVVGAMSLVNKSLAEWGIYAGIPVKRIRDRSKHLLEQTTLYLTQLRA